MPGAPRLGKAGIWKNPAIPGAGAGEGPRPKKPMPEASCPYRTLVLVVTPRGRQLLLVCFEFEGNSCKGSSN